MCSDRADVIIIGAGWAGLSAAVHATLAGARVLVLERAPAAGGRAREIRLEFERGTVRIDSGQHALLGAYRECLFLAERTAADQPPFERVAMQLSDTRGLRIEVRSQRAPWHLAGALWRARGLTLAERAAAFRLIALLRLRGWRTLPGETVAALLQRLQQPDTLVQRLWQPLCVGVMNTAPQAACAAAFAAVLRDTLGAPRAASDFLVPRGTLDAAVTRPALRWLQERGATVACHTPARTLRRAAGQWHIDTAGRGARAPHVIVAAPPADAARLVNPLLPPGDWRASLHERVQYELIASVLLAWPRAAAPALPRWTLLHDDGERAWGQWLFDRGCQGAYRLASVVISVASALPPVSRHETGRAVACQVARQIGVPLADIHHTVMEKKATIRCTPDRPRFHCAMLRDRLPGLWLAGDHVDDEYPATLETAVRSGRRAARAALGG